MTNSKILFYSNPVPLSKEVHAKAGLSKKTNYSFANKANVVPVNVAEFAQVAKYYPIVFSNANEGMPLAILGAELDQNLFVNKKGEWEKNYYIPAYVRRYPFTFMGSEKELLLCVDDKAESFNATAKKDDFKFFEDGEQAQVTKSALEFCKQYHEDYIMTREFMKMLNDNKLLVERKLTINIKGKDKPLELVGFSTIEEKAFLELDKDIVSEWHKNGALSALYSHLNSTSNWNVITEKLEK